MLAIELLGLLVCKCSSRLMLMLSVDCCFDCFCRSSSFFFFFFFFFFCFLFLFFFCIFSVAVAVVVVVVVFSFFFARPFLAAMSSLWSALQTLYQLLSASLRPFSTGGSPWRFHIHCWTKVVQISHSYFALGFQSSKFRSFRSSPPHRDPARCSSPRWPAWVPPEVLALAYPGCQRSPQWNVERQAHLEAGIACTAELVAATSAL